jgi:hypothetical protein
MISAASTGGMEPEFKRSSQRCRFAETIVVPRSAVLDPVMSLGCASAIAEAA